MKIFQSFEKAIDEAGYQLRNLGYDVHPDTWQSIDVSKKPEMATREVMGFGFRCLMAEENLDYYRSRVKPNLPWADNHFEQERVSGMPINPGTTWREWPWGNSADKFRSHGEKFSHSYAERYWPKYAGVENSYPSIPHRGIRYSYGDLDDVVTLLVKHPETRQAFLPVFFPEDTGCVHGERIPCSIGYQFIRRNNYFHVSYWLRSCDYLRHFRDDIYLTVRLALWVLEKLREKDPNNWERVKLGWFSMWITSLHIFKNDTRALGWDK